MKKQTENTLASEIIRNERKQTMFWFTAFVVTFAALVIDITARKRK